jgi:oligopeptide transport system ATP-binding protein
MESNGNDSKNIVLSIRDLRISFKTDDGLVHAVRGVSFDLYKGETLCIVGESGSGKSVTSKTIMGILPASAVIEDGSIMFEGEDLTKVDESEFHRIRGHKIGMIFQDPLSSLNPIMKVGKQITEAMLVNHDRMARMYDDLISKEEASYKNNKVRRDATITRANQRIVESDASFDDQMRALDREMKEKSVSLDKLSVRSEEYPKASAELSELKKKDAAIRTDLNAKKKEAHKKLAKEARLEIREAKALYRKDNPILRRALAESKKKAKKEMNDFKAKKATEHEANLSALTKEENDLKAAYQPVIAQMEKNLPAAASQIVAKKEIEDKNAEFHQKLDDVYARREKENRDYKAIFKITRREAKEEALKVMKEVGIPQPEIRFNQYPFEFSGGMRQRIVIAIALTANPEVLICDEPTTALDVTIQAQILELINKLKRERHMSIIFITHDLGVVANMADRVAVMYAGKIVEVGTANEIFYDPRHPYTWALLSSIPDIDSHEKLEAIPGTPPYLLNPPKGDAFAARNKYALAVDFKEEPPFFKITETHYAATWLLDARAPKTEKPRIVSQRIKASLERAGVKNESELERK